MYTAAAARRRFRVCVTYTYLYYFQIQCVSLDTPSAPTMFLQKFGVLLAERVQFRD